MERCSKNRENDFETKMLASCVSGCMSIYTYHAINALSLCIRVILDLKKLFINMTI